ncbi:Zgc:91897 [Caligus rogercresseyi]|uniref:Zgc:91897 n=1 Tax=Caligus rogercresseyi TaxID=217165 RepID=A0A7T8QVK7_CALRO|nr:Zgc:91897 [Caligus rogercresseyi]
MSKLFTLFRLPSDVKTFRETSEKILPFLLQLWEAHHSHFVEAASKSASSLDAPVASSLEKAVLSLKLIRKVLVFGLSELPRTAFP